MRRRIVTSLVSLVVLAGCSSGSSPQAAPTSTTGPATSASSTAASSEAPNTTATLESTIIGTWRLTRSDDKPQQVGEVCHFFADHNFTCTEPNNAPVPGGTWKLEGDHTLLEQAAGFAIATDIRVLNDVMTLTSDRGSISTYARVAS